jgi:hypothetical protein
MHPRRRFNNPLMEQKYPRNKEKASIIGSTHFDPTRDNKPVTSALPTIQKQHLLLANPENSTMVRNNSSGTPKTTIYNLCQANDFYLGGRYGKDNGDELEALYDVLNLPKNWF